MRRTHISAWPPSLAVSLTFLLTACAESDEQNKDGASVEREGDDANECEDGADNDADGAFDCDDSDCAASPVCEGQDSSPTNHAPEVASVVLSPTEPRTNDTLVANVSATDADGDPLSYDYDWYVNGVSVQTGGAAALSGTTAFDRGDVVSVTARVSDGSTSTASTSSAVTVLNSVPTRPSITLSPSSPANGDDLTCTISTSSVDVDGDEVSYTFAWTVDGTAYTDATVTTSSSTVSGSDVHGDELWTCSVVASDGVDRSDAAQVSATTECTLGSDEACPASSCLDILNAGASRGDDDYWLDAGSGGAFEAYCDMSTDGGGWTLIAQGGWYICSAHTSSYPEVLAESSNMTSADTCSYLPYAVVSSLAGAASEVRLSVNSTSETLGSWTSEAYSTNAAAISALRSSTGNWHNGATWSSSWVFAGASHPLATGWPNMYHSDGTQGGVHWLAVTAHSHVSYGSSYSYNPRKSATWLR